MKSFAFNLLAAALVSLPAAAGAATMSFDALPDEGAQLTSYSENGITATGTGGVLAQYGTPGSLHVDDSGSGLASTVDFTTGGLFDAQGFRLASHGYSFWDVPGPLTDNIFVTGFLGGAIKGSFSFILSDVMGAIQAITLGSDFAGIDRLQIRLDYPVNSAECDAPCGHFDLEEVTLSGGDIAPVPLPASAGLLLLAAGLLAGVRARHGRRGSLRA